MRNATRTLVVATALVAGCASDGTDGQRAAARDGPAAARQDMADVERTAEARLTPASAERASRQFAMLKELAGSWVPPSAEGSGSGAQLRYEVTSGGHAVVETIFPAQPHEMVSVYHLDNGRLVMTHYCAMGNQPFFTSVAGTPENVIKLTCTGAHNTKSHAAPHMHEGVLTIGDGTLHAEWTLFRDLEPGEPVVIDVVRGDM